MPQAREVDAGGGVAGNGSCQFFTPPTVSLLSPLKADATAESNPM
jgi:hypothetical protein